MTPIRRAGRADLGTVTTTLAEGFLDGDFADWLIPDAARRAEVYPPYFTILAGHALEHGWIDLAADGAAAAVWFEIGDDPAEVPAIASYDERLADAVGPALPRFQALDTALEHHHPAGQPHHYLAFLAVRPGRRGQGLGSALLAAHHARLDRDGIPAYLEATGPVNQRLYLRHGYTARPQYRLTDGSPAARPMWRQPR